MKDYPLYLLGLFTVFSGPLFAQVLYVPSATSGIGSSSTGNVGIGTSSPGAKLQVEGNGLFVSPNSGTSGGLVIRDASGNPGSPILQFVNNAANAQYGYVQGVAAGGLALMGGNVGVGLTSASTALEVNGDVTAHATAGGQAFRVYGRTSDNFAWAPLAFTGNGANYTGGMYYTPTAITLCAGSGLAGVMTWLPNGDVGIGTTSPGFPFHVKNAVAGGITARFENTSGTAYVDLNGGVAGSNYSAILRFLNNGTVTSQIRSDGAANDLAFDVGSAVAGMNAMYVNGAGNVGIGTTSPSHKLAVNGAIRAKEVIVDTGWSDYVFAKDYRLAPLSEVERAIEKDGHLPGIPSAKEVAEHGVSMGEMQSKLLAKVEELTLYMIEMKKDNAALRKEVNALKDATRQ